MPNPLAVLNETRHLSPVAPPVHACGIWIVSCSEPSSFGACIGRRWGRGVVRFKFKETGGAEGVNAHPGAVLEDGGLLVELFARAGRVDERRGDLARAVEKPVPIVVVSIIPVNNEARARRRKPRRRTC